MKELVEKTTMLEMKRRRGIPGNIFQPDRLSVRAVMYHDEGDGPVIVVTLNTRILKAGAKYGMSEGAYDVSRETLAFTSDEEAARFTLDWLEETMEELADQGERAGKPWEVAR